MTGLISTVDSTEPALIKTDVLGRMHRTPEQRERILNEYERSGVSAPKFAALCGVKYQTFASWLVRRKSRPQSHPKRQPRHKRSTQVQWIEASVQSPTALSTGLQLQLPGGVRAQLSHPEHIALAAALVRALEKSC